MNSMKNRKILFIVEGKNDEPAIIKQMYKTCFANEKYEIFPYETDIHDLIKKIFVNGDIDEAFDIQAYLRANCSDSKKKAILNCTFSDIFLVFDLDAQDNRLNESCLVKLQRFFSESTENGKLYINYPSIEAYKNVNKMPDLNFRNSMVHKDEFTNYKSIVDSKTPYYTKTDKLDKRILLGLALHHLKKLNLILSGKYETNLNDGISSAVLNEILNIQLKTLKLESKVYVLSMMILHLFEYRPIKMLEIAENIAIDLI